MKPNIHDHNQPHEFHPDLEALLQKMPSEEAERLRDVWMLADDAAPPLAPSPQEVEHALERFMATVETAGRPALNASPVRHAALPPSRQDRRARQGAGVRRPRRIGWIALAAVLLAGGLFWWFRPVTHVAGPGEPRAFTLPDGSRVELNSGSSLRYARRFDEARHVHLHGEAFFDVVEDEHPFVVETFNAEIRVVGTRFGVRAWPGSLEEGTTVALEAGRVALAPTGQPEQAVEMVPGETRRVAAGVTDVDLYDLPEVSVDDATAWRRGDFVFKNQLLGVVLDDVERRYAMDIRMHPPRLQHTRLSLALRQPENAETIVRDLALALGLAYRETSNGFELYAEAP